jgi:hypothetical protein
MISITKEGMLKQNPNITSKEMEIDFNDEKIHESFDCFSVTIAMYSFIGLLYSLIVGAIVKKCKSSKPN